MKTINVCKTKHSKSKAWFRWPCMPSDQETDPASSTAPGTCMSLKYTGDDDHDHDHND